MKEFKVRGDISKKSLEEAFREWNKIRSKYVRFMSFFLPIILTLCIIYSVTWSFYREAVYFSLLLVGSILFWVLSIYIIIPKWNTQIAQKMLKKKNPDRDSYGRTFTIRESYLYSEWDEEAPEEKELGQILRVEPVKNHLIIFAGFFESTSENNSRVRLKRYLCIVQKDAFVEGTAKELYDYLRENYPQMKFGPWRD